MTTRVIGGMMPDPDEPLTWRQVARLLAVFLVLTLAFAAVVSVAPEPQEFRLPGAER